MHPPVANPAQPVATGAMMDKARSNGAAAASGIAILKVTLLVGSVQTYWPWTKLAAARVALARLTTFIMIGSCGGQLQQMVRKLNLASLMLRLKVGGKEEERRDERGASTTASCPLAHTLYIPLVSMLAGRNQVRITHYVPTSPTIITSKVVKLHLHQHIRGYCGSGYVQNWM